MGDTTCSAFDIQVEFSVCIAQILYICDNEQQSGGFWSSDYAGGTAVVHFMVTCSNYFLV